MPESIHINDSLPTFLIFGAMKCGTTSLAYYLGLHPEIFMATPKELHFFNDDIKWRKGVDWYKKYFSTPLKIRGEASPSYSHVSVYPEAASRIYKTLPDAKLIYVVRDPVERTISNYVHFYASNRESRSVEEIFQEIEGNPYVDRSCYGMQLEQYLQYFSRKKILVLTAEELNRERAKTLEKVFRFLEVSPTFWDERFQKKIHQSSSKRRKTPLGVAFSKRPIPRWIATLPAHLRYPIQDVMYWPLSKKVVRPQLKPEVEASLIEYFRPDIEKLEQLTGRTFFDQWSRYQQKVLEEQSS